MSSKLGEWLADLRPDQSPNLDIRKSQFFQKLDSFAQD